MDELHLDGSRRHLSCACGETLEPAGAAGDQQCPACGAWYNAFGQRLRDDWMYNPAWSSTDERDIDDLEGFEISHSRYEQF